MRGRDHVFEHVAVWRGGMGAVILHLLPIVSQYLVSSRGITEHPHTPGEVAAFMSAHSKTPYITPSMDISSGKRVVRGRRGLQLGFFLQFGQHSG